MDFILDELIIIMFLSFIILLFASSIIAVNFHKFTYLETKNFYKKKGVSVPETNFLFSYKIKSHAPQILKEKITYFKDE